MTRYGLGRRPRPPDRRDYRLGDYLDPLDLLLAAVLASHESKATKAWAAEATRRIKTASPVGPVVAPPVPPPATEDVVWADLDETLDQLDTPHCVAAAFCQWGNTQPVDDHYTMRDAHAIYYEAKILDGEPGEENGTDIRSGAKVMKARGRLDAYAFAATVDEVVAFVRTRGPVVFGTSWHTAMFEPDDKGRVGIGGPVEGGHAFTCVGHLPSEDALLFQNSWGDNWSPLPGGRFTIAVADVAALLADQGDACAAIELPV